MTKAKKKVKKKPLTAKRRAVKGKKVATRVRFSVGDGQQQREFSLPRQRLLESQLARPSTSARDRLPQRIEAVVTSPPETRSDNPLRQMPSGEGPFGRGNDTRSPFSRR
jgi:hypothetical protein